MNKTKLLNRVLSITIILSIFFLGIYLCVFNSGLSFKPSDWGSSGSYFSGTIGICFSLLSVILIYLTYFELRKQQFENTFQQYILNYYSLLNFIKERWLHTDSDSVGNPRYQNGREIFGNAVGYIKTKNARETFIEIFNIHNNVFQHYCNYLIELFKIIEILTVLYQCYQLMKWFFLLTTLNFCMKTKILNNLSCAYKKNLKILN